MRSNTITTQMKAIKEFSSFGAVEKKNYAVQGGSKYVSLKYIFKSGCSDQC